MNRMLRIALSVVFAVVVVTYAVAQEKKITQTAGVDNTRMGAYRALAQLSFQGFQKGDNATAAELARVLERTWDQGEWHNTSEGSYCKANGSVCQPIDQAMDVFINPIMNYAKKAPDAAAVQAAYNNFLEKLKQAE
jgi:hypothetical protein